VIRTSLKDDLAKGIKFVAEELRKSLRRFAHFTLVLRIMIIDEKASKLPDQRTQYEMN
jgi:hypothetical protein